MNRQIEVFPNQPRDSDDQLSHELLAEEGKLFANIVLKYIVTKISTVLLLHLILRRPLRRKLRISTDSSLIRQK